jgi:hypothetical protein
MRSGIWTTSGGGAAGFRYSAGGFSGAGRPAAVRGAEPCARIERVGAADSHAAYREPGSCRGPVADAEQSRCPDGAKLAQWV